MDDHDSAELGIEDLIELQRSLMRSESRFERVVGTLCVAGLLKERLDAVSDRAVGQLMFDYVWNDMNALSPELAICEVATDRLLNSSSYVKTKKENPNR
jgi:hypothetical protein